MIADLTRHRAQLQWEHWHGAAEGLFYDVPTLLIYITHRNMLSVLGGYWVSDDGPAVNDNEKRA